MADLVLKGMLNLTGMLTLKASGGKVMVETAPVLVEIVAPSDLPHGVAPPVLLPPPKPLDDDTRVWVINSFNKMVKAGNKNIVALGMVMEGGRNGNPIWPGMVLPSQNNKGPVTINGIAINVLNDKAIIFANGGTAMLSQSSGQI